LRPPRLCVSAFKEKAFTLVELILVMALLATLAALSVPSLSRSMRQRYLAQEAARFLALTEYGRDEAVSQGVPMIVWIDSATRRFGIEPKTGYEGATTRQREFELNPDVQMELTGGVRKRGVIEAMEFSPAGALATTSLEAVRFVDRFQSALTVARASDGWAYEIVKEVR